MDLLNELDTNITRQTKNVKTFAINNDQQDDEYGEVDQENNSVLNFKDFDIFKSTELETGTEINATQMIHHYEDDVGNKTSFKKSVNLLGINSNLISNVLSRLNGKSSSMDQSDTQPIQEETQDTQASQQEPELTTTTQEITNSFDKVTETQQIQSTLNINVGSNEDLFEPQKIPSVDQGISISKNTVPLFVSDDDDDDEVLTTTTKSKAKNLVYNIDDDDDEENVQGSENHVPKSDRLKEIETSMIEDYKNMTREEKIQARVQERARIRKEQEEKNQESLPMDEKDDDNTDKQDLPKKSNKVIQSKKSERLQTMTETIRQNELIKKQKYMVKKQNSNKFKPTNLINNFNDSESDEDEVFSYVGQNVANSPGSSPKKLEDSVIVIDKEEYSEEKGKGESSKSINKFTVPIEGYKDRLLQESKSNVVTLDSDSDSDVEIKLTIDKKTQFEIQHKFSKKSSKSKANQASKKKDIKQILKEEKAKQFQEFKNNRKPHFDDPDSVNYKYDNQLIDKLLQDEIQRNLKIKQREKEIESRKQVLLHRNKAVSDGDDSEYSDYSNDDIDSDSGEEEEEIDDLEEAYDEDGGSEKEKKDKDDNKQRDSEISDNLGGGAVKFNNMSLSDAFDQTLPQNKSFDGLNPVQVVNKLRRQNNNKQGVEDEITFGETTAMSNNNNQITVNSFNQTQSVNERDFKFIDDDEDDDNESGHLGQTQLAHNRSISILESQNFLPDTQIDVIPPSLKNTQKQVEEEVDHEDDEDDDENDEDQIKSTRRLKNHQPKPDNIQLSDSSDDEGQEDEETKAQRAIKLKEMKKRQEQRRRQKEREFKNKGLNQIMENEAVESEDEWQGIGGLDGEDNNDVENSEDERMIDDLSNDKVDEDKIRASLVKNQIEYDDEMVKKIFKDIKTGGFRKRRAKDGAYELDLSDDDDNQILKYYENRKIEFQKQQLMKNKNLKGLSKDIKSKAFYNTIVMDPKLTGSASSFQFEEPIKSESESDAENDVNPFTEKKTLKNDDEEQEQGKVGKSKRRKIVSVQQVRSAISFLHEDDDYKRQDVLVIDSDDDGIEEIRTIKQNSTIKITNTDKKHRSLVAKSSSKSKKTSTKTSSGTVNNTASSSTQQIVPLDFDADSESDIELEGTGMLSSMHSRISITESFRMSNKKANNVGALSGRQFQEVNITTSSRPIFNTGKSFINSGNGTGNGKMRSFKSDKVSKIENNLKVINKKQKNKLNGLFNNNSGFE